ncbi:diaminopimelate epimerase [Leucothrix arctica]|uniref:Diaminopimelate epimerase n=1 Tax=Leucothrix arctica TaxID=1481894 RepID=A0A317CFM0_9GAMM|nr:diaminopimelate epimerase [Leucothrix arctica]PWQ97345.1 diaminopimelate epimerase [Leucothrix arctica]
MNIKFTKMHGLGNDFVMINAISQSVTLDTETVKCLADRNMGIGCDQLLVVEPSPVDDCDFRYRIFNSDGGEVQQCGNGARCFARFVVDEGLTDKTEIPVLTAGGRIVLTLEGNDQVTVDMGQPVLEPADIPFIADSQQTTYRHTLADQEITFSAVSMGNPHAVMLVKSVDDASVKVIGKAFQNTPIFPEQVNAGFMQIIDRSNVRLRVYERGAGETMACGTGACAAIVAGILQGLLDESVTVILPAGNLTISWAGIGSPVMMTGPVTTVFNGTIKI